MFCDCKSAVQVICNPSLCGNFQDIIWSIRQLVDELNSSNTETLISWVGGHIDLKPNDLADDLAKKAAEEARGLTESPSLSYSEFKNLIKLSSLKKMADLLDKNSSSLNVKEFHPKVPTKRYISVTNKSAESKHMKIVSGHNKLQIHRHKIGFSKTSSCECGYPIQDEKHIMLHCPIYLSSQEIMINSIERTFNQEAALFWKRKIDLSSVLSPNLLYAQKVSNNINYAVYKFLGSLPANLL